VNNFSSIVRNVALVFRGNRAGKPVSPIELIALAMIVLLGTTVFFPLPSSLPDTARTIHSVVLVAGFVTPVLFVTYALLRPTPVDMAAMAAAAVLPWVAAALVSAYGTQLDAAIAGLVANPALGVAALIGLTISVGRSLRCLSHHLAVGKACRKRRCATTLWQSIVRREE
jgi:hypothetical protein